MAHRAADSSSDCTLARSLVHAASRQTCPYAVAAHMRSKPRLRRHLRIVTPTVHPLRHVSIHYASLEAHARRTQRDNRQYDQSHRRHRARRVLAGRDV